MSELLHASLGFPTVVFTIALGIVLVYWLFVLLGALDIDLLGSAHVDVDGGGGDVDIGGHDVGGHDADAGGHDADADGDADGDSGGLWHGLGLGAVPLTISISVMTLVGWVTSLLVMHYALRNAAPWLAGVMLLVFLIVTLPITAILVRPLAPAFRIQEGKTNADWVGQVCTINTGTVDDKFGDATIKNGTDVVIIQVRCDPPAKLAKGDRALVIDFDPARKAFLVEPAAEILKAKE